MRRETKSRSPICGFDSPSATRSTTARSLRVRLSHPWVGRGAARARRREPTDGRPAATRPPKLWPTTTTVPASRLSAMSFLPTLCGHADARGPQQYNVDLSRRRAAAVKDYLTSLDVPESKLDIQAFGEIDPAVPQAETEAEHRQNRRVEFVIVRQ